jgi:hypothetical protein
MVFFSEQYDNPRSLLCSGLPTQGVHPDEVASGHLSREKGVRDRTNERLASNNSEKTDIFILAGLLTITKFRFWPDNILSFSSKGPNSYSPCTLGMQKAQPIGEHS